MKSFRFPIVAICMSLFISTACNVDTNSQAKTDASQEQVVANEEPTVASQESNDDQDANAHFEAGLAAYKVNNLTLVVQESMS